MSVNQSRTASSSGHGTSLAAKELAWGPFWSLRSEINDVFDDFYRGVFGSYGQHVPGVRSLATVPAIDVIDKDSEVKLVADLAGLDAEDIDVQVTNGTLTIAGEKKEEVDEGDEEGERYMSERRFGSFMRRISLPEGIDEENIEASFKNGVLTVHLPKKPEAQHPSRKIEVRAGN